MNQAEFRYNGNLTVIQCNENDKMSDVCNKFVKKAELNINTLYFIHGGEILNYELTFKESLNKNDKDNNNKMIILVNSLNEKNLNKKNIIYSKEIICP